MLAFLRGYQKFFQLCITIVVVISFSFFGTYGVMGESSTRDEISFTAIDGSAVTRSESEDLQRMISTEYQEMRRLGSWGPNFLNDGVIAEDIVKPGLAKQLLVAYQDNIASDFNSRFAKERRFEPYQHPGFRGLSAEELWRQYHPNKMALLQDLQDAEDPLNEPAIDARIGLYLEEREFGGQELKQALLYAQKMHQSWLRPDQNLPYLDLSLFGYHSFDDWFGPKFLEIVTTFIINASKEAERLGYTIPNEEVWADLTRSAAVAYQEVGSTGRLGVANAGELLKEQLRRLHMDQNKAIKTWRRVMLFRRLFQDVGTAVVADPLVATQFLSFAKETVSGQNYVLPKSLELAQFRDLQLFETYCRYVAEKRANLIALPTRYFPLDQVDPALVQQCYQVEYAKATLADVGTRVSVRDTWSWELDEKNWGDLIESFPELGLASAQTQEARESALEGLDRTTRSRVDAKARLAIAKEHPEWVEAFLNEQTPELATISLRTEGGEDPLPGVSNRKALRQFLNESDDGTPRVFAADGGVYYRLRVLDQQAPSIMTFAQAKEARALDTLTDRDLENYYVRVREAEPTTFQTADGEWKEFRYVREEVAGRYYSKILRAIQESATAALPAQQLPKEWTPDLTAPYRLLGRVMEVREALQQSDVDQTAYVASEPQGNNEPLSLEAQWKLEQIPFTMARGEAGAYLALKEGDWTTVESSANGQLGFRLIDSHDKTPTKGALIEKVLGMQELLSRTARQDYMRQFLETIKQSE